MKRALVLVLIIYADGAFADSSDDTLSFWLGKSDLVVLGRIVTLPSIRIEDLGTPIYHFDFNVSKVLTGDADLQGATIPVTLVRFERAEKDRHPLIMEGSECILFLDRTEDGRRWVTVDPWFGIQYPSPWMARSLKRLAGKESLSDSETLPYYLAKSDLIVAGEILNEPGPVIDEEGVPNYYCDFAVSSVLKGNSSLAGTTIRVDIVRFEAHEKDHLPLIKKGGECILFLKKTENTPAWETADFWFGVQPRNQAMEERLTELDQQEGKQR